MPTRAEFAAQLKAKYPVYASIPDEALVDRVLEKYPVYRDRITTEAPRAQAQTQAQRYTENQRRANAPPNDGALRVSIGDRIRQTARERGMADLSVALQPGTKLSELPSERERAESGAGVAPIVGGALGGMVGGAQGAALGGALGEASRQMVAREHGRTADVAATPLGQARDIAVSGAVQGGLEYAGGRIVRGAERVSRGLRESALKKITQALGATKEKWRALATRRAPEILQRGLHGSRARLLRDATAHAREAAMAVDDVLTGAGDDLIPTAPILDALQEAKNAFTITREMPVGAAMNQRLLDRAGAEVVGGTARIPTVIDPRPVQQLTELQHIIQGLGDDVSVSHLAAVRRVWDDVVARAGGYAHRGSASTFGIPLAEQTEAWAKREGASAIRKQLAEGVPDLAAVNAEFAFWRDLQSILSATAARTQAQGAGLTRTMAATVGTAAGALTGDDWQSRATNAAIGGVLAPRLAAAFTSAPWQLMSAQARNQIANAIASGIPGRVMAELTRVTGTIAAGRATDRRRPPTTSSTPTSTQPQP